ncbi:XRE family transcriptional regulator [Actinopolymorpha cephalotaxi]
MSRQEMADQLNTYLFRVTGREFGIDANYVGKLERGVIRWPQKLYRDAFRAVLGASTDRELGFFNPRRAPALAGNGGAGGVGGAGTGTTGSGSNGHSGTAGDSGGTAALSVRIGASGAPAAGSGAGGAGGAGLVPAAAFALLGPLEATPIPSRIGRDEIGHVRAAAVLFSRWDHSYGGGFVRDAVVAQLRWSARLLQAGAGHRERLELHEAVGHLAHVAGFMAFDAYAFTDAERLFRFALACAEAAGTWHLRAKVLSSMARLAVWRGQAATALGLTDLALVRSDRITPTEQAMLLTARARGLARLGRTRETLRVVGAADDAFARSNPAEDPPWMAYYDAAQHAGDTGHALFDLEVRGYPTEAGRRLAAAVAGHTPVYARSRTISRIKLASLLMATDDPREGVAVGTPALEGAGRLRSRRTAEDLRELRRYAGQHANVPDVADLRRRIGTLVG